MAIIKDENYFESQRRQTARHKLEANIHRSIGYFEQTSLSKDEIKKEVKLLVERLLENAPIRD